MTTTNDDTNRNKKNNKNNNNNNNNNVLSSITYKETIVEFVSWWCYAVLKHRNLSLFNELQCVLNCCHRVSSSVTIQPNSSLSFQLRCLVPWHELLIQLYTEGVSVSKKRFDRVQDSLVLLHERLFAKTGATEPKYVHLVESLQTHSVLSKLYKYLSDGATDDDDSKTTDSILKKCNERWKMIYLNEDRIPQSLMDLVDTGNGWNKNKRKDCIVQIVSAKDSTLRYRRLMDTMQSLLLRWFENEIKIGDNSHKDARVSELLKIRYRGIGFGADVVADFDATFASNSISNNNNITAQEKKDSVEEQQQEVHQRSKRMKTLTRKSNTSLDDPYHSNENLEDMKQQKGSSRKKRSRSAWSASEKSLVSQNDMSESTLSSNISKRSSLYSTSNLNEWDSDASEDEIGFINRWTDREDEGTQIKLT